MPGQLQVSAARPRRRRLCLTGGSIHEDTTAKWFLLSAISYFFVVGIIALTIAAKFVWPQLLGTVPYLDLWPAAPAARQRHALRLAAGRRHGPRLLHCAAALRSEAVEREAGRRDGHHLEHHRSGRGGRAAAGHKQRMGVRRIAAAAHVLVVVAWVMFGINIFATIASRKYQQMYVSLWYIMGTILWTTFVYLTGNIAVYFTTGVNQANLNWMYVHNAVGLIFTPIGLAIAYYFIPRRRTRRSTATNCPWSASGRWPLSTSGRARTTCCTGRFRSGCRPSPSRSR